MIKPDSIVWFGLADILWTWRLLAFSILIKSQTRNEIKIIKIRKKNIKNLEIVTKENSMAPVQIPCPYAPDCLWQSIPLDFDKALILVEQHVRFKHPEAAEQSAKVC